MESETGHSKLSKMVTAGQTPSKNSPVKWGISCTAKRHSESGLSEFVLFLQKAFEAENNLAVSLSFAVECCSCLMDQASLAKPPSHLVCPKGAAQQQTMAEWCSFDPKCKFDWRADHKCFDLLMLFSHIVLIFLTTMACTKNHLGLWSVDEESGLIWGLCKRWGNKLSQCN